MANQVTPSPSSNNKTKATINLPSAYLPVVHLNGTGRQTLKDDYYKALESLDEFRKQFASIEFHARDYYVINDDNAYNQAREVRNKVFTLIEDIESYLTDHVQHVMD